MTVICNDLINFAGLSKNVSKQFVLIFILSLGFFSCTGYNKLLKSDDAEKKYEAAKKYYDKKNYVKAAPLLDDLLVRFRGDKRFEEVYYLFAYCKYGMGEIALAGYHFKNFYESFPLSTRAEDALYMYVYCSYVETYPYYLDPDGTRQAMDNFQLFVNVFPASARVEECNKYLDELRGRLRRKSLETARMYMKMEDYRAAIVCFKNTMKDYPEIDNRAEIQYNIVKATYLLAQNSVDKKKKERYEAVQGAFDEFVEDNGTANQYYKEAFSYKQKADQQLTHLK